MKKLLRATVLLLVSAAAVLAVDYTAEKPQGYVSDFAGVVDAASRQRLEQYCTTLQTATGVQIAIVTVPGLNGEPVDQFANDLFRKWGVGQKGKDNGVLLLLAIADRRNRLELGYGLEPAITDGLAGDVLRSMTPYLRAGRYGDALLEGTNEIGSRIAQVKGVSLPVPAPRPLERRQRPSGLPSWLIPVGIFAFLLLLRGSRGGGGGMGGFLTGMILGNMMGGRGGGNSGGGFGGFDSGGGSGGGGFGGFGGGDSGGGGASGSW